MAELFNSLGIEWKVIIAQIVNFAILFFVLRRFAVGPIMRILDNRQERILKNQRAGEEADKKIAEIEASKDEIIRNAREESEKMMLASKAQAAKVQEGLVAEARRESLSIISLGKKSVADEKKKAETELKKEIGALVVLAVEKALGNALDKSAHGRLVDEARAVIAGLDK